MDIVNELYELGDEIEYFGFIYRLGLCFIVFGLGYGVEWWVGIFNSIFRLYRLNISDINCIALPEF